MIQLIEIFVAIVIVVAIGPLVKIIVDRSRKIDDLAIPDDIDKDQWLNIVKRPSGGLWIGNLERLIFLFAFWHDAYNIIAAWLAFKIAAKWQAWKNIVQVPTTIETNNAEESI